MPNKKSEKQNPNMQQEKILEAVVIADSFDRRFYPISAKQPRCLFPLANRPLLSYTLEFLASCEVKHLYVYCCHCAEQIKEYLANSKWMMPSSPCKVTTIVSSEFSSVGDVLRDVDQKSLFESNFIVVHGDIVSNLQLKTALEEHEERRAKDKNVPLMTLVMSKSSPKHHLRSQEDDVVIASDCHTNRVLHYHKVNKQRKVMFPMTIFENPSQKVEIRYDLVDTGIWICAPQVPALFTDNFDYQTQFDFIKGILINEEFLGNQIHMHVVESNYCSRVNNLHTYGVVSKDVSSRWTYPFVPDYTYDDLNTNKTVDRYNLLRHNVYIHQTCVLEHETEIRDNCVIGPRTKIGSHCKITNSVIGAGCTIADDCIINGCYIWNGVKVGQNCTLHKSIVCNNVQVLPNVQLKKNCVICHEVKVGPDLEVANGTTIYLHRNEHQDDTKKTFDVSEVGNEGQGFVWKASPQDNVDYDVTKALWGLSLNESYKDVVAESSIDEEEEESDAASNINTEDEEDDGLDALVMDEDLTRFQREVKESLAGGFDEKIDCDNLVLEINSSKYAYNMSINDVVQTVMRSTLEIAEQLSSGEKDYFSLLKSILIFLTPLLCKYNKSSSAQLDYLFTLEEYASKHGHAVNSLVKIFMLLYEHDVICEEVIHLWNANPRELNGNVTPKQIRQKVEKFIQWLLEAEEEDSDD